MATCLVPAGAARRCSWALVLSLFITPAGLAQWSYDTSRGTPPQEPAKDSGGDAHDGVEHVASRTPWNDRSASATSLDPSPALEQLSNTLRSVVEDIQPSIVHIEAQKQSKDANTAGSTITEAGAGVLLSIADRPAILTNFHVIRESREDAIDIFLSDGRLIHPQKSWWDESTDVAVLGIESAPNLRLAAVGDSSQLRIGDFVLAYGSPFGLSYSVSHGIVSAKGRRNLDLGIGSVKIQDFIQTDAAINPGNSGGPLLNLKGEVIALNTAMASNSGGNDGIGFSIPINLAMDVAERLVREGRVPRPYLGVGLDPDFDGRRQGIKALESVRGARVTRVATGSPAATAGVRAGDIIARVNEVSVEDDGHLMNLVGTLRLDGPCKLSILREGKPVEVAVRLQERPGTF